MDIRTLARLGSIYIRLTLAQRHHLRLIAESRSELLSAPVCPSLVDLGLVRSDAETFGATEDGLYVARLL